MPRPFAQLYLHLVWATWDRLPLITPAADEPLHQEIRSELRRLGCIPLATGGTENHVHCLIAFPATLCVAEIVKQVKGASSHLMTHVVLGPDQFKWQGSYSAFTVHKGAVEKVREYVLNQKQHHACGSVWAEWERTEELP